MVLILLLISGLIIGPLLSYMGTGLSIGNVYEGRTNELYAADAGVEDAIWKIQQGVAPVCPADPDWSYNISDVNGKSLQISIEYLGEGTYRITSTAVTDDGGGTAAITGTAIESYVSALYMDFSSLLDNAIVSQDTITISPNSVVNGDVWLPICDDEHLYNKGNITGEIYDEEDVELAWPTAEQLSSYYLDDVNPLNPYPYDSIDIKDTQTIGTCYREGSLAVDNTGDPATLVLEGTVYVTGDLEFEQSGSHGYTVDLNGNTIFVGHMEGTEPKGSITFPSEHVSISGSGCIIAVGDIDFHPSIVSGEDDFVLVLSIAGEVQFHPNGIFTGCIAGNVNVDLQPNSTITVSYTHLTLPTSDLV